MSRKRATVIAQAIMISGLLIGLLAAPVMAKDWYVRPAGGNYGLENGASYDNAWDGLTSVVWGGAGINRGDTLWVCGTHVHDVTNRSNLATQADQNVALAAPMTPIATAAVAHVTIRGDYPNDQGIVVGGYRPMYEPWVQTASNVWRINLYTNHYSDWFFEELTPMSFEALTPVGSLAEVISTPGSQYSATYKTGDTIYVHLSDNGNPTGRTLFNRYGHQIKLDGASYVTVKGIDFFIFASMWGGSNVPHHIRIDGCKFIYGESMMFRFLKGMDYMEIVNSEIAHAGNGIYSVCDDDFGCPSYYNISNNYFHDIGNRLVYQNGDAHAIGIQGGNYGLIEGNRVERAGTGPFFYAFDHQEMKYNVVSRNYVKDCHEIAGANNTGIATQCENDADGDKSGNKFYYNVVENCKIGYRFQFEQVQEVYNNVAVNCETSYASSRGFLNIGPRVKYRNNISYFPSRYHILYATGGSLSMLDADYNIYFPDGTNMFRVNTRESDFKTWQAWEIRSYVFDPHSKMADPMFLAPSQANFNIHSSSDAVNAGVYVGLNEDKDRNPIVGLPDIGAYETTVAVAFQPPVTTTEPPAPIVQPEPTTTTEPSQTILQPVTTTTAPGAPAPVQPSSPVDTSTQPTTTTTPVDGSSTDLPILVTTTTALPVTTTTQPAQTTVTEPVAPVEPQTTMPSAETPTTEVTEPAAPAETPTEAPQTTTPETFTGETVETAEGQGGEEAAEVGITDELNPTAAKGLGAGLLSGGGGGGSGGGGGGFTSSGETDTQYTADGAKKTGGGKTAIIPQGGEFTMAGLETEPGAEGPNIGEVTVEPYTQDQTAVGEAEGEMKPAASGELVASLDNGQTATSPTATGEATLEPAPEPTVTEQEPVQTDQQIQDKAEKEKEAGWLTKAVRYVKGLFGK